jgi:ADP-heptose:LPS heptosyltransferase
MSGRFPILYLAEADPEEAVLSSGVLAHLVETIAHANFTVVGSPSSAPLFADTPRLNRLIVLEKEGALDWIGLWNQVRKTRWGLVVDMRGCGIAKKLTRQKRAEKGEVEPGLHAVEAAAAVLHLDEVPAPKLFVGEETQSLADALIKPDERPILAVGPGVEWMGKRWPAERFAKVATPLLADDGPLAGGRLMIVGEEIERDSAHTIRFAVPRARVIELQGKLTPLQTAAALKHAELYLGNDSLWTQLAVAAGVPSVAVFGPSDETARGPWKGASVRGPRTLEEFKALDPRLNQAIQHMMDLPYERVLKAARKLLAERSAS